MDHKIKIKLGSLEIEYEGDVNYLKNDLPALIDKLSLLNIPPEAHHDNHYNNSTVNEIQINKIENQVPEMSTNSIAAKLPNKTGPDLVMIACAHLALVQNKNTFNRQDILKEMKNATNYYKESVAKNLTASLKTLVSSNKLIERSSGVYAIAANELKSITPKLNGN
jgi:hypothetical protein